jgi:hypothetical protein
METDLKYTIQNTDAVTVSLNELEAAGPEMTYIFMAEMVTMENIYVCLPDISNLTTFIHIIF